MIKLIEDDVLGRISHEFIVDNINKFNLIIADPAYGKIVKSAYDHRINNDVEFVDWMLNWVLAWSKCLVEGGSFLIWGGIGKPRLRPFYRFASRVESYANLEIADHITWKKRRAYGKPKGYLFCREELLWLVNGKFNKPAVFNIPLLDQERGYEGYNKKYPAKSKFLRRSNVWTDITEKLKDKLDECEKAQQLYEVILSTHSNPGDTVIDLFAGSGTCAAASYKLGRNCILVEEDSKKCQKIKDRFLL